MGGKAILYLVMGFSLIFLVLGQNFGRISTEGVANSSEYFTNTVSHNIAVSGANMAANEVFIDPTWTAGLNNISFDGGTINVNVQILDAFKNIRRINSVGVFQGDTSRVQITLQPSAFSKFAYYSEIEPSGIWWTNGDTVWGPFHTQDYLRVAGHPVFNGKVSTKKGIQYYSNKRVDSPILNGGYQQGVDLPIPSTSISALETAANSDGHTFTGNDTVSLSFMGDSIRYTTSTNTTTRVGWRYVTTTVRITQTVLASTFAPNGVIFADNAVLRVSGVVKGQYTVGVSGSSGKGDVYLDGDVTYNTNPKTDPHSTDLLGIVANNNVWITDNSANQHDINIDAAIFCQTGGFGAQNYSSGSPRGTINLLGGITQHERRAVGTFSYGGNIATGYNKRYYYDNRLMYSSPPSYPNTGIFEIVSWYE